LRFFFILASEFQLSLFSFLIIFSDLGLRHFYLQVLSFYFRSFFVFGGFGSIC